MKNAPTKPRAMEKRGGVGLLPSSSACLRRGRLRWVARVPPHQRTVQLWGKHLFLLVAGNSRCSAAKCIEERGYSFLVRLSPLRQNALFVCVVCWRPLRGATVFRRSHLCVCVVFCIVCWRKPKGISLRFNGTEDRGNLKKIIHKEHKIIIYGTEGIF